MQFIDIKKQYQLHKEEINQSIQEVLEQGNFILGKQIGELEEKLANYVGVKHCITVASGTDSLVVALMALGIGPGDEVITTPFTFIATAEVIKMLGATPVFVDIDPETYNLAIDQIESAITPRTTALMPVSLFGQMPDYQAINAIASKYHLPVIEDGAQSFGATQKGKRSCGVTTVGSTSFFPAKPFGCYGDGGALFTNDDALAETMRAIRTHGSTKKNYHPILGMNARFDTIQAAVLLAKFPHFEKEVKARNEIGARYSEKLKDHCVVPTVQDGNTHVYAQYTIRVPNRDEVAKELKEKGIPTAIYYPKCLHQQPIFEGGSFPHAEQAAVDVLSLPMHPWLTVEDQDTIIKAVIKTALVKI